MAHLTYISHHNFTNRNLLNLTSSDHREFVLAFDPALEAAKLTKKQTIVLSFNTNL